LYTRFDPRFTDTFTLSFLHILRTLAGGFTDLTFLEDFFTDFLETVRRFLPNPNSESIVILLYLL
jgi:hypothetical protein